RSGNTAGPGRVLAYALLWPGLDVHAFCGTRPVSPPSGSEWVSAAAKTFFGAAVVWVGAPLIGEKHPIVTGWVGMIGVVLVLHFGLFHLLSAAWRALGISALPLMRSPVRATSLSGFWGESWNAAFSDLMHESIFKPLTKSVGPQGALFLVF